MAERTDPGGPSAPRPAGLPFNVQERDIDLLLIEQLHLSTAFVDWLTRKAGVSGEFESARHSVHQGNGESDVLLFLSSPEGRVAVMIEDKIGAPMQPRQCERYHERGRLLCERGEAARYTTVLCAPAAYLAGVPASEEWQTRISLEELSDWFHGLGSAPDLWRCAILMAASSKVARARQADERSNSAFDETVIALKTAYRALVEARYPQLIATAQTGRDREYYLKGRGLPTGIRLKHSFFRGEVSLIFERSWAGVAGPWLATHAPAGAWTVQHGGELHLRLATDVMDPGLRLDEQEETAAQALDALCRLAALAGAVAELGAG